MINSIYFENNELKLKSSAATPILYREMFKRDLIKTVMNLQSFRRPTKEETEKAITDGEGFEFLDFIKELAFVMNLEATVPVNEIFKRLTFSDYVSFLSSCDERIFTTNANEIITVWSNSQTTTSQAKNAVSPQ